MVYVDNDPMVLAYGRTLLGDDPGATVILADVRDPDTVLGDPVLREVIDFTRPVGVLITAVLHFVSDQEEPHGIIAEYGSHMAAGSYLAITHGPVVTAEEDPTGIVGSVTSANATGTSTAPNVPNMNSSTASAIGTATASPWLRSLL